MNKCIIMKLLIFFLITIFFNAQVFASNPQRLIYKLKALYIVRLAEFITWPEEFQKSEKDTFKICINPNDKIAIELKAMEGVKVKGRGIEIVDPPSDFSTISCDFLYLTEGKLNPILANIPIVTLSSHVGFAEQGGMIEFYINLKKVKMKANLLAVDNTGIKFSSKLVRLLKIVKDKSHAQFSD